MTNHRSPMTRRQFLIGSLAGTGLLATSAFGFTNFPRGAEMIPAGSIPTTTLGRTGETVSIMGIGCAPFQAEHITPEHVREVFDRCRELGINYLDVAPNYGNADRGFSEEKMGPALQGIREDFFLVTKTEEPTRGGTWRLLEQSMNRMQTDYLDLVHIHNFGWEDRFPDVQKVLGKDGTLEALQEAQEQGVIRFIGASGHLYPSRFHAALDTGKIDVLMNAVNFVVRHSYDFEHKVWARARQENLGLVAMKVLGGSGGAGFRLPEQYYKQAIRYALSIPEVTTAVIGIQNLDELAQAAQVVGNFQPLTDEESRELATIGLRLAGTSEWEAAYGDPVT